MNGVILAACVIGVLGLLIALLLVEEIHRSARPHPAK